MDRQTPLLAPILAVLATSCCFLAPVARAQTNAPSAGKIDFAREIRPLLSDRCYTCHGPDAQQRSTELRLDQPESALELAITPGQPENSELIARIFSSDPDYVMPPPQANLALNDSEKQKLRSWIEQGAEFATHWSFDPPRAVVPPAVDNSSWTINEIDRFVVHELEQRGLTPAPEADRETLIRRVTFDITGLPPSVAEMDAFLADASPGAYERLVDRLLASEKFGERMAVDWLDAARYADTHGYQSDRYRAMWPWRDWVVQAFNQNLPFDQFITWQLAGDLLPNPTREQKLATAFNRNHRQTNEGGSVEEEFRAEYVADRVNTFGTTFLGLTLECSRCHDHKYDPISQRDYYQLSAFFNSIDESGLYSHFTDDTPTPALTLSDPQQADKLASLEQGLLTLETQLRDAIPNETQLLAWRSSFEDVRPHSPAAASARISLRETLQTSLREGLIADYPMDEIVDGKLFNRTTDSWLGRTSEQPEVVVGQVGNALKLSGENNASFSEGGTFTRDQPFSIGLWIRSPSEFERAVILHRSRAWTDAASRGYELLIEQGKLSAALIHFWPGDAIRVVSTQQLPLNTWTHVAFTYDGSSRAEGLQLYVNGDRAQVEVIRDQLTRKIHGDEANELALGQRFRDVGFKDGQMDELKIYNRQLTGLEVKMLTLQDAAPANVPEYLHNVPEPLLQEYLAKQFPPSRDVRAPLQQQLAALRKERSDLIDSIPEIMVMRETEPRPAFILTRGAYDAPGDQVERATPQSILPVDLGDRPDRLDLARWLTHADHPLTARVAVNRFWRSFFGRGIVATTEDFGLQGASPSHPELLDWMARRLIDSEWNVKALLKSIVMSATYRQQSNPSPALLEADPENVLLARGPSSRLPAEMIRDSALAASGLLVQALGGPPVKPYQPPGLWEEKSGEAYERDAGAGSRRRSLYTYWKRTSPPPSMMTFDASNREVCIVSRQVTMTPLQVLVLLNDPQLVEAAIALAEQAMGNSDAVEDRLQFIFRSLCSRSPSQDELQVLRQLRDEQFEYFAKTPQAAQQLFSIGDHQVAQALAANEVAALAVVAEGLMSYDEFVMKR